MKKIFTIQTTEYIIYIFIPTPFQLFVPFKYFFLKPAVIHCNQFIP